MKLDKCEMDVACQARADLAADHRRWGLVDRARRCEVMPVEQHMSVPPSWVNQCLAAFRRGEPIPKLD